LQLLSMARQQSTSNCGNGQGQRDGNATATALTAMVHNGATERRRCGNGYEIYNNQLANAVMDGATVMAGATEQPQWQQWRMDVDAAMAMKMTTIN
jgi:hypothetical protein